MFNDIQDSLLQSIKPAKSFIFNILSEIFRSMKMICGLISVALSNAEAMGLGEAFSSIPSLRCGDSFDKLSEKHKTKTDTGVVRVVKEVLMSTKNYTTSDADNAMQGKPFCCCKLLYYP